MIANKSNPKLWEQVKKQIQGNKKWNARMAQQAVKLYKDLGGDYINGDKNKTSLKKWTDEDWGYIEGTKRYLPKKIRDVLSDKQKKEASKGKKLGTKKKYPKSLNKIMKQKGIY
jgi:hypothetical protein